MIDIDLCKDDCSNSNKHITFTSELVGSIMEDKYKSFRIQKVIYYCPALLKHCLQVVGIDYRNCLSLSNLKCQKKVNNLQYRTEV